MVAGLADEVVQRLRGYEAAGERQVFVMSIGHQMDRVECAPEVLKLVLDDMVTEAGVQPMLHAQVCDVVREGERIHTVRLLTKSGVIDVHPRVVIDISGDIDVLHRAGARFLSVEEGDALQPATMMFRFGAIDFDRFDATTPAETKALARQAFESGELARAALHSSRDPYSSDGWFNISRLGIDATDATALSQAEIEGRRQARKAAGYLRRALPGCEDGRLRALVRQVGIRETRRVEGEHVLTAQELTQPVVFADGIACGAYPIDIYPAAGGELIYSSMGDDHAYQIPYRSFIPKGISNALVAGRGISATHAALACEGEGAVNVRSVDAARLRDALVAGGALVDP